MITRICRKCGKHTQHWKIVKESEYQNRYYCQDNCLATPKTKISNINYVPQSLRNLI